MKKRRQEPPNCGPHAHSGARAGTAVADEAFARAAALFRAAGDEHRMRLIEQLGRGELCVTELAEALGTKLSTLSQQLKVLRGERIVKHRRDGKHIFYSLADDHVRELVRAALEHASEPPHAHDPYTEGNDDEHPQDPREARPQPRRGLRPHRDRA